MKNRLFCLLSIMVFNGVIAEESKKSESENRYHKVYRSIAGPWQYWQASLTEEEIDSELCRAFVLLWTSDVDGLNEVRDCRCGSNAIKGVERPSTVLACCIVEKRSKAVKLLLQLGARISPEDIVRHIDVCDKLVPYATIEDIEKAKALLQQDERNILNDSVKKYIEKLKR